MGDEVAEVEVLPPTISDTDLSAESMITSLRRSMLTALGGGGTTLDHKLTMLIDKYPKEVLSVMGLAIKTAPSEVNLNVDAYTPGEVEQVGIDTILPEKKIK